MLAVQARGIDWIWLVILLGLVFSVNLNGLNDRTIWGQAMLGQVTSNLYSS